jgi:hypothetical protein
MAKKDMEYELLKMENEKLRLEVENLKHQVNIDPNTLKDIEKLVSLAGEMRNLLMQCRNEQINYKLAKEIDYVINEASELD